MTTGNLNRGNIKMKHKNKWCIRHFCFTGWHHTPFVWHLHVTHTHTHTHTPHVMCGHDSYIWGMKCVYVWHGYKQYKQRKIKMKHKNKWCIRHFCSVTWHHHLNSDTTTINSYDITTIWIEEKSIWNRKKNNLCDIFAPWHDYII